MCPSLVYADMAFTAAEHSFSHIYPQHKILKLRLRDMQISKPLLLQDECSGPTLRVAVTGC